MIRNIVDKAKTNELKNIYNITYSGTVYGSAPGEGNIGIQTINGK
jgi:hypothetical protein